MAKGSSKAPGVKGEYSQKRLDKALYIAKGNYYEKLAQSEAAFGEEAGKFYAEQSAEQKEAIQEYTGAYYSDMNRLLRDGNLDNSVFGHDKAYVENVTKKVKAMQEAISKHSLGKDVWLQRGTDSKEVAGLAKSIGKDTLDVGDTFVNKQFVSAGTAKGTGFDHGSVIMHIFAPKTAKGLYVDSFSKHKGENETILAAGQRFKVKKRYKTDDGKWHFDLHIIP